LQRTSHGIQTHAFFDTRSGEWELVQQMWTSFKSCRNGRKIRAEDRIVFFPKPRKAFWVPRQLIKAPLSTVSFEHERDEKIYRNRAGSCVVPAKDKSFDTAKISRG
jgi:hypothetical protein